MNHICLKWVEVTQPVLKAAMPPGKEQSWEGGREGGTDSSSTIITPHSTANVPWIPYSIILVQQSKYSLLQQNTEQMENIKSQVCCQSRAAGLTANAKDSSSPMVGCKWRKCFKAIQSLLGTRLCQAVALCSHAG